MASRQVRVVDNRQHAATSTNSKGSRGWQILRSQWREFLHHRPQVPDRVLSDGKRPRAPARQSLSNEDADRALQFIISTHPQDSPESIAGAQIWRRAEEIHGEVRLALNEKMGWNVRNHDSQNHSGDAGKAFETAWKKHKAAITGEEVEEEIVPQGSILLPPRHEALMPNLWWRALGDELLAELVVDAFASALCDAFIDGAVVLVEVAKGWSSSPSPAQLNLTKMRAISSSASDPNLQLKSIGQSKVSFDPQSPFGGTRTGAATGFTMAGLPSDDWEAWNSRKYHACQPLEPYAKRIAKNTEAQRPHRRMNRSSSSTSKRESGDMRRYNWPMTATNFPEAYDSMTEKKTRTRGRVEVDEPANKEPVLSIGRDGRTLFPYSLVSHRAFLDSQPDALLKEKANKLAPLKTTSHW